MAGGGGGDGKTPTLNVVSMVDVIFNVIVFFIITAKAANDEMVKLVVPKVDTPAVHVTPEGMPRLVVSVVSTNYDDKSYDLQMKELNSKGALAAIALSSGRAKTVRVGTEDLPLPAGLPRLTKLIIDAKATRTHGMSKAEARKQFEVLLRADLALPYSEVRPVMNAISAAGIENVNLMAYKE